MLVTPPSAPPIDSYHTGLMASLLPTLAPDQAEQPHATTISWSDALFTATAWAKAMNTDHANLLRKIDIDEVVIPHIAIRQWAGQSVEDLDLTNRFGIQVIAAEHKDDKSPRTASPLVILRTIDRMEGLES